MKLKINMRENGYISLLLITAMFLINMLPVRAMEGTRDKRESIRCEQISDIIDELNVMAARKATYEYMIDNGVAIDTLFYAGSGTMSCDMNAEYDEEMQELEQELEDYGVYKLDAASPDDMQILKEMSFMSPENLPEGASVYGGVYDSAPDLSAFADAYSIYKYDATYIRNGVNYNYRIIHVVDNKGRNGLFRSCDIDLIDKSFKQGVYNILQHNFSYGLSKLICKLPGGLIADWILGNVFEIFKNVSSAQISVSNEPVYRLLHTGLTEMQYIYVYNNGWKLAGVGATAAVHRTDIFSGNVNGELKTETEIIEYSFEAKDSVANYISSYLDTGSCYETRIGSLDIIGYSKSGTFTPAFARYPSSL